PGRASATVRGASWPRRKRRRAPARRADPACRSWFVLLLPRTTPRVMVANPSLAVVTSGLLRRAGARGPRATPARTRAREGAARASRGIIGAIVAPRLHAVGPGAPADRRGVLNPRIRRRAWDRSGRRSCRAGESRPFRRAGGRPDAIDAT